VGAYYDIYAEVSLNGKWANIDRYVLGLDNKYYHASLVRENHGCTKQWMNYYILGKRPFELSHNT